jgi:tRNA A-37 threonylcarbamoyl transferase component Bud32
MSTSAPTAKFINLAQKSGLIDPKKLEAAFDADVPDDPNQAAEVLVKAGLLTTYQCSQLLAGKFRGFILGPYKILRPIGKGGMGIVFLAEHTNLQRKVAVKVLAADKAKDKLTLERFQREGRAAAALQHPNIVGLHDISQGNGVHFLVMEYVEGKDLHTLIAEAGPLPYAQAAQYIAQAAAGLRHAHEKGIIHRDIKPSNLILATRGTVKILDMGLARSFHDQQDQLTNRLAGGDVAGTAEFLSPEQALNQPLDERSDIYSLGATFHALLTGHPSSDGTTEQNPRHNQVMEPPSEIRKLDGRVPPGVSDIIAKMMARRLCDRYQTAADVIDALGPWLPAKPTGNIVRDPVTRSNLGGQTRRGLAARERLAGTGVKRKHLYIAAGGAALFVAILVAVFSGGKKADRQTTGGTRTRAPTGNAPPQAAPGRQPIISIDFTGIPEYRGYFSDGKFTDGGPVGVPAGVRLWCWRPESVAQFRVSGGAVGQTNLNPTRSAEFKFFLDEFVKQPLRADGRYEVRFEYKTDNDAHGQAAAMTERSEYFHRETLPSTGGEWRLIEFTISPRPDSLTHVMVANRAVGEGNTLWVRSFQVFDSAASSE